MNRIKHINDYQNSNISHMINVDLEIESNNIYICDNTLNKNCLLTNIDNIKVEEIDIKIEQDDIVKLIAKSTEEFEYVKK